MCGRILPVVLPRCARASGTWKSGTKTRVAALKVGGLVSDLYVDRVVLNRLKGLGPELDALGLMASWLSPPWGGELWPVYRPPSLNGSPTVVPTGAGSMRGLRFCNLPAPKHLHNLYIRCYISDAPVESSVGGRLTLRQVHLSPWC